MRGRSMELRGVILGGGIRMCKERAWWIGLYIYCGFELGVLGSVWDS